MCFRIQHRTYQACIADLDINISRPRRRRRRAAPAGPEELFKSATTQLRVIIIIIIIIHLQNTEGHHVCGEGTHTRWDGNAFVMGPQTLQTLQTKRRLLFFKIKKQQHFLGFVSAASWGIWFLPLRVWSEEFWTATTTSSLRENEWLQIKSFVF